jgi:hypothetical protein
MAMNSAAKWVRGLMLAVLVGVGGCASSYLSPGAGISPLQAQESDLGRVERPRPTVSFPAAVAVARIQASGYRSYTTEGFGSGQLSVVTNREIERDQDIGRLARMPGVAGLMPVTRILLPERLDSTRDLRRAVAPAGADLLLVYTVDTSFRVRDQEVGPLNYFALGFLPNQQAQVSTTISAALFDVHSGFIYGTAESSESMTAQTNIWKTEQAVDETRLAAERKAMEKLVPELERLWIGMYARHQATLSR